MRIELRPALAGGILLIVALLACKRRDGGDEASATASQVASAAAPVASAPLPLASSPAPGVAKPEPEPEQPAVPEIPEGRSKPPTVQEWSAAEEVNTQEINSQPDACFMKIVREWLKVNCAGDVRGFSELEGFGRESADYFSSVRQGKSIDFVVRLRQGKTMKLRIQRGPDESDAALFVNWPPRADRPSIVALGRATKPKR